MYTVSLTFVNVFIVPFVTVISSCANPTGVLLNVIVYVISLAFVGLVTFDVIFALNDVSSIVTPVVIVVFAFVFPALSAIFPAAISSVKLPVPVTPVNFNV